MFHLHRYRAILTASILAALPDFGQFLAGVAGVLVIGAEVSFPDFMGMSEQGKGFGVAFLVLVKHGQVVGAAGYVGIVVTEKAEGLGVESFGFVQLVVGFVGYRQFFEE